MVRIPCRSRGIVLLLTVAMVVSGCIPVRTTSLEGAIKGQINRIDDRGIFSAEFGTADAATTDGRFALYSLRKEAEWWVIGGSAPLGEVEVGTTHVMVEFGASNETLSTSYRHCDDDSDDAFCRLTSAEVLWDMIRQGYGDEEVARLQALDELHASLAKPMHDAAAVGDIDALRSHLARGASISADVDGLAPVHRAALTGQIGVLEFVLEQGVSIRTRSSRSGETLLHLAANGGQIETIDWLLERGVLIDAADGFDGTPLQSAIANGQNDAAFRLLEAGADADPGPGRLVLLATRFCEARLVEALIERGAKVNTLDAPLNFAPNSPVFGPPALYYAVTGGKLETAAVLLNHGARIEAGANLYDPLHAAINAGDAAMVELLLEHGANPDKRIRVPGQGRITAKERAENIGQEAIVQLLESYGASG